MAKSNTLFMCSNCGNEFKKWVGQCPYCKEWNTISQINLPSLPSATVSSRTSSSAPLITTPKKAVSSAGDSAFPTGISELDRVLGKGLTPGGVYLLAGQPGIGKSTLLTQLSLSLASQGLNVLYMCSEENAAQVGQRISRLSAKNQATDHINLLQSDTVEDVVKSTNITQKPPSLIIIDSIQSIGSTAVTATPGTISQIRACSNLLIHLAKTVSVPVILVGHVTKAGTLAGPKLLEHMVDVVLDLEGDRHHDLRLLRGLKNRFGPTDETGIFSMTGAGLTPLADPSAVFLSHRQANTPGSCLTLIMEGTRPLTVEIQALTVRSELAIPRRVPQGITQTRLQLICAILTKHLRLPLGESDVFVNVTGGITIREPAADLAIALAIISSHTNTPLPEKSLAVGELGLLGEIRTVPYLEKRLKEAKTLGYTKLLGPDTYRHLSKIDFAHRKRITGS